MITSYVVAINRKRMWQMADFSEETGMVGRYRYLETIGVRGKLYVFNQG